MGWCHHLPELVGGQQRPLVRITPELFVKAYLVDAIVDARVVPANGQIVDAPLPTVSEDWQWVVSGLSQ